MTTTIAQTILDQLGGRAFVRMTGAKNLIAGPNYLSMRLPWPRVNAVKITLEGDDTYKCVFMFIRGTSIKVKGDYEGTYCDQLAELFREQTGLETRMPTVRFS